MSVTTEHPDYVAVTRWWIRCRDVADGRDAVLAGGTKYLPQPVGQSGPDYLNYLNRASFLPVLTRTIAALAGAILRRPPTISGPDALLEHLTDVTLRGESLTTAARWCAHEVLTVGRFGVLVDFGMDGGTRPYWSWYRAEDITNWRTTAVGGDPVVLTSVLREMSTGPTIKNPFAHEAHTSYRELALNEGVYQVRVWTRTPATHLRSGATDVWQAGDWITPTRRGLPLDFVPFTFVGPTGTTPDVARPPLLDLVDVSLSHYRNSADREHALFFTASPTPWVSGAVGDGPLKIGPGAAWMLGENGKAGLLEFTGQGVGAIERAMREKEQAMVALGAQLLEAPEPVSRQTATASLLRHAGQTASLRTIASSIGAALTALARMHEWWMRGQGDVDQTVRVDIADDLDRVRISSEDVKAAMLATQSGLLSPASFYGLLESGGWTRPGVSAADEREAIVAALRDTEGTNDDDDND